MTYIRIIAIIDQEGTGCDYTIGCGIKVMIHNPHESFIDDWLNGIMENYGSDEYKVTFYKGKELKAISVKKVEVWRLSE